MGLRDGVDKLADKADDAVKDVRDAVSEAGHRSEAEAEKAKREAAGDEMTTSEKTDSFVNQKKNEAQAEIDAAKRHIRDHT